MVLDFLCMVVVKREPVESITCSTSSIHSNINCNSFDFKWNNWRPYYWEPWACLFKSHNPYFELLPKSPFLSLYFAKKTSTYHHRFWIVFWLNWCDQLECHSQWWLTIIVHVSNHLLLSFQFILSIWSADWLPLQQRTRACTHSASYRSR